MNTDVKKLIVFSILMSLFLVLSYQVNDFFYRNFNYELPEGVEMLITGSSLVSNGIDPDCIPGSDNISLAAEPLVLSYYKLKDILTREPKLKRILLSYSMIDVAFDWDNSFIDGKKNSGEMIRRLIGLRKKFDIKQVSDNLEVDYFIWWEQVCRYRLFPNMIYWYDALLGKDIKYSHIGNYITQNGKLDIEKYDFKELANKHFPHPENESLPVYGKMNNYLDSIINLSNQYKVELYVIGMPMPPELYSEVSDEYKNYYRQRSEYLKEFSNVHYLDYTQLNMGADLFFDFVHLNKSGAAKLSREISERICSLK